MPKCLLYFALFVNLCGKQEKNRMKILRKLTKVKNHHSPSSSVLNYFIKSRCHGQKKHFSGNKILMYQALIRMVSYGLPTLLLIISWCPLIWPYPSAYPSVGLGDSSFSAFRPNKVTQYKLHGIMSRYVPGTLSKTEQVMLDIIGNRVRWGK